MELANTSKLRWGEIAKVTGVKTVKNINNPGFEEDGRLRVNEMKSSSRTPSGNPMKGSFERGGPGSGEDGERVALGGEGLDAVVVGVVGHDSVDEVVEIGGGGGEVVVVLGGGGELVDEVVEVVQPGGVEGGEVEAAAHWGSTEK